MEAVVQKCRQCGADIPVNPGYTEWCDQCGWNIDPKWDIQKKNKLERISEMLGKRLGRSLHNSILSKTMEKPRMTVSNFFAYLFSGLVYLIQASIMALFIILGIVAICFFKDYIGVFLALLLFLLAFLARPRFFRAEIMPASKEHFSHLYGFVNKLAREMGSDEIDGLIIDGDFNASFTRVGFKGKRYISIGLPLYSILTDQERVAVIAHEIAHGINRDIGRGRFIGGALRIVVRWYRFMHPMDLIDGASFAGPFVFIWNIIRLLISKVILIFWHILSALRWRNSQRAEYYADYLASKMAGSEATVTMLGKLYHGATFETMMHNINYNRLTENIFKKFSDKVDHVPPREMERIKRLTALYGHQIDASHPPTAFRIESIRNHFEEPSFLPDEKEMERIGEELQGVQEEIQKVLLHSYRQD